MSERLKLEIEDEYNEARRERIKTRLKAMYSALEEAKRTVRMLEVEYDKAVNTPEEDWVVPSSNHISYAKFHERVMSVAQLTEDE